MLLGQLNYPKTQNHDPPKSFHNIIFQKGWLATPDLIGVPKGLLSYDQVHEFLDSLVYR